MRTLNALLMKLLPVAQMLHRSQQGFAFIVVLGILLLVTGLALVAFNTSDTDRQISANSLGNTQAYYAAEAGVSRSLGMFTDSLWRAGYYRALVKDGYKGYYSVEVLDSFDIPALKDSLLLRSTGKSSSNESVIEVLLKPMRYPEFKWAAFGDTAVGLMGGAFFDSYDSDSGTYASQAIYGPDARGNMYAGPLGGNVGGNGDILADGNLVVHGNVATPDTVIVGTATIYGTTSSTAPTTSLPPITTEQMDYAKANSNAPAGLILTGGASYDPATKTLSGNSGTVTLSSGIYYFSRISMKSDIIIAPGAQVKIYTDGNIDAKGDIVNTSLTAANFQIYSTGSTVSLNSGTAMYAVVYAPNAAVTINGSSDAYGSFIGKSVKGNGGAHVHFDRSLLNINKNKQKFAKVAWHVL